MNIKSHAESYRVKFDVIYEIERHSSAVKYRYEWQLAEEGQGKVYRAVMGIELRTPVLFASLYTVLAVIIFLDVDGVWGWVK